MKINIKSLLLNLALPLGVGFISAIITSNSMEQYEALVKPPLAPPPSVFPIVWTILFILMGISSYIIWESTVYPKKKAFSWYLIQLVLNAFWTIIFFNLEMRLFAFFWLLALLFAIGKMIYNFAGVNKVAAYLQIPYFIWVVFAGYLNLSIYLLNK